jgi:tetratricopeptide (TPR) repeat protein
VPDAAGAPAAAEGTTSRDQLDPDTLAALEEQRDFLLRSLRDLEREHEAGDLDDGDYELLRDDYTARAARVLHAIEDRHAAFASRRRTRSRGRTALTAAALVLVAGLAVVGVVQASRDRAPGDTITGDIRETSEDRLDEALQAFGQGDRARAIEIFDDVLAEQPANAEALTYKAWATRLEASSEGAGSDDPRFAEALTLLERSLQADPDFPGTQLFRAIVLADLGRNADAVAALDELAPADVPEGMDAMVGQFRAELSSAILAEAEAAVAGGQLEAALRAYDLALQADPTNGVAPLRKASLLLGVLPGLSGDDAAVLAAAASQALDDAEAADPELADEVAALRAELDPLTAGP